MELNNKIKYFDYFISQIVVFNSEGSIDNCKVENAVKRYRLSRLKLLKLLFFLSVIDIDKKYLVDDVFDNFHAMPYGPVESDIYNQIDKIPHYFIGNKSISLKDTTKIVTYQNEDSDEIYQRIREGLKELYKKNSALFTMSSYDLVELSHKADSWRIIYSEAQRNGKFSQPMSPAIIKSTTVYFR